MRFNAIAVSGLLFGVLGSSVALSTEPSPPKTSLTAEQKAQLEEANKAIAQSSALIKAGKRREALPLARKALASRKQALGNADAETIRFLTVISLIYAKSGEFADARACLEEALDWQIQSFGERNSDTASLLNSLGSVLERTGEQAAARRRHEQSLAIFQELLGEKHPQASAARTALARVAERMGDYDAARDYLEKELAITRERRGDRHPETARCLCALGSLYNALGDYANARSLHEQALAIYLATVGDKDPETAVALSGLGTVHLKMRDMAAARACFEKALAIRKKALGDKHAETAASLNQMGLLLIEMGNYAAAQPYLKQSLAVRKELLGDQHPDTISSLGNLGLMFRGLGDYAAARKLMAQALASSRAIKGNEHPSTATLLLNLGQLLEDTGSYAEARRDFQEALAIFRKNPGEKHPCSAMAYMHVGNTLLRMDDYAGARRCYEQALVIDEAALGRKHPDTATAINNLGIVLFRMGKYGEARLRCNEALAIIKEVFGEKHPDTATMLDNQAGLLSFIGDYAAARTYREQALAIKREALGDKHPDTTHVLISLGATLCELGDFAAGARYFTEALQIRREVLGENHPDTAAAENYLGVLGLRTRDYQAAEEHLQRALSINRTIQGERHPETAEVLENLTLLRAAQGDWPASIRFQDSARRISRRHIMRVLSAGSEDDQLSFLEMAERRPLHVCLSLGLLRRSEPLAVSCSATWLANGKASSQEVLAQRSILSRASQDPAVAAAAEQLAQTRQQLARLAMSSPKIGAEQQRRAGLARLESQEERQARDLAEKTGGTVPEESWIELDTLRRSIPVDAVLVDVARFKLFDFNGTTGRDQWGAARYAAWIISPSGEGEVEVVDLGPADAVDAVARRFVEGATFELGHTPSDKPSSDVVKSLFELSDLIYRPLKHRLAPAKRWFLSPDAALWLIPWAALPVDKEEYAIERHVIQYLVSSRDLVRHENVKFISPPLVMADPDFDLAPDKALAEANELLPPESLAVRGESRRATDLESIMWSPLPGTGEESNAILPTIDAYAGVKPLLYRREKALEAVFKSQRRPRVVILSTHGFFRPADGGDALRDTFGFVEERQAIGKRMRNPLLRCGLALAGANRGSTADDLADDGILTGLEIVGTDLRGTELVVLSACETGLGDVRSGQGVAGLRQAFQLAGAQAVVATLWKIPDRETTWLMIRFWVNLAAGQSKAEALRDAQLTVLHHRDELRSLAGEGQATDVASFLATRGAGGKVPFDRERADSPRPAAAAKAESRRAHPLYWAAFTLTGADR